MAKFITLSCPTCGAKINADGDSGRFRCDYCGNEHLLQISVKPVAPEPLQPIRPKITPPDCIRIEKDGQSARIVQRWFSLKYIPMAFFCVVWNAFLLFWYGMAFSSGAPVIFLIFPLAHLAVGIGLTYSTISGFVNRTVLEVTPDKLDIWFEPLPWLGEKTISTRDLKQLFCKESITHGSKRTTVHYHLYAITQDDREVKLLGNVENSDIAQYFEQQIENWLRIEDRPVVGEFHRQRA